MNEFNVIVYLVKDEYEIKTWLKVDNYSETPDDVLDKMAIDKFKRLGVEINKNDSLDFEQFQ